MWTAMHSGECMGFYSCVADSIYYTLCCRNMGFISLVYFLIFQDACLLSSLEDGLNALLNIEVSFMNQLYHCHSSLDRLNLSANCLNEHFVDYWLFQSL